MIAFISVPTFSDSLKALLDALICRGIEIHTDITTVSVMARAGIRYHTPHPDIYTMPVHQYQWLICSLTSYPLKHVPDSQVLQGDSERCAILLRGLNSPNIVTVGDIDDASYVTAALQSKSWNGSLDQDLIRTLAEHTSLTIQTWVQRSASIRRRAKAAITA